MTYFLLLSPYEARGRRFARLDAPSVLAWFQRVWRRALDGDASSDDDLGGYVEGFDHLLDAVREERVPLPHTCADLESALERHLYYERDLEVRDHFVRVETDDDEVKIEYFFFDDAFVASDDALDALPHPDAPGGLPEADDLAPDDASEDDDYAAFIRDLRGD